MQVPFYRPDISEEEIEQVVLCLRSGWLTTGPLTRRFEEAFGERVGAAHAVALNSCTAALHLAVEALGLGPGQAVLVPTLTFAATAEVIRYQGAVPILVDCDPGTGNIDLQDAERKIEQLRSGQLGPRIPSSLKLTGIIPVHVAGLMVDQAAVHRLARAYDLWVVEDAAHSLPAAWRPGPDHPWQRCGEGTAAITCFSFYVNKTMTTGEGGMAVTNDRTLAERMRCMALHGLSRDAWQRYSGGPWDYRILAPGYKYNLTDIASALGLGQLERLEAMRQQRERLALAYLAALSDCEALELPESQDNRIHAWHLFTVRLRLERLGIDRDRFIQELKNAGVGCSVHWRPLHLHPYYEEQFHWDPALLPQATREWPRRLTLPLFPSMREEEFAYVVEVVRDLCSKWTIAPVNAPVSFVRQAG